MLDPKDCKGMDDIREAIDNIDENIVKLIAKRSKYVNRAADFKKDEKEVRDSKRVAKVIESKKELALKYEVYPELIGILYKNMIDFFISKEMDQWKLKKFK